jgi:hypothetical protein
MRFSPAAARVLGVQNPTAAQTTNLRCFLLCAPPGELQEKADARAATKTKRIRTLETKQGDKETGGRSRPIVNESSKLDE